MNDEEFREKVREVLAEAVRENNGVKAHRWGSLLQKTEIQTPRRRWAILKWEENL